jgi:hypothetical protein
MSDDFTRSLEEDDDSQTETWKPEEGDRLVGQLISVQEINLEHGAKRLMKIRSEQHQMVMGVWFSASIASKFDEWNPQIGERVGLFFHGMTTTKSGRPFKKFSFKVDRPAGVPSPQDAHPGGEPDQPPLEGPPEDEFEAQGELGAF